MAEKIWLKVDKLVAKCGMRVTFIKIMSHGKQINFRFEF